MEGNVWMQWFVRIANFLSSLSASLSSPLSQSSGGASPSAQGSAAPSTSTSSSATSPEGVLRIIRNPSLQTTDALFGSMDYDGMAIGVTMERTAAAIPEGEYRGCKRESAHFGMLVVGIDVPNRTNIECHPANYPSQLLGCVAIGGRQDGDALDNSRDAFDRMMAAVPDQFTVRVSSQI
jgi:hypothetical protein